MYIPPALLLQRLSFRWTELTLRLSMSLDPKHTYGHTQEALWESDSSELCTDLLQALKNAGQWAGLWSWSECLTVQTRSWVWQHLSIPWCLLLQTVRVSTGTHQHSWKLNAITTLLLKWFLPVCLLCTSALQKSFCGTENNPVLRSRTSDPYKSQRKKSHCPLN